MRIAHRHCCCSRARRRAGGRARTIPKLKPGQWEMTTIDAEARRRAVAQDDDVHSTTRCRRR